MLEQLATVAFLASTPVAAVSANGGRLSPSDAMDDSERGGARSGGAPVAASSGRTPGRSLSRPGRVRTVALWHPVCLRHAPSSSCPEQATRLRAVVAVLEELQTAHPARLAVLTTPREVATKYVCPTVHSHAYVSELTRALPRPWEPPVCLGSARACANSAGAGSGLVWADGERRSTREHRGVHATAATPAATAAAHAAGDACRGAGDAPAHDLDTFLSAESMSAARHAAGAVCEAVDLVMRGACRNAFVAARPPGHHAGPSGLALGAPSQGFCLLNHVAIGARYALLTQPELARVAIFDFDVHHGNGTQQIVANDPSLLFLSLHVHDDETPFFPATGGEPSRPAAASEGPPRAALTQAGTAAGSGGGGGDNIVNLPLARNAGRQAFRDACSHLLRRMQEWRPQLIVLSAGFDAHADDPLGGVEAGGPALLEEDFGWLTTRIVEVADAVCAGRIVSVLEGGYSPPCLRRCVGAHVTALLGP